MSDEKGWKALPQGGIIDEAGNAEGYETGSWRTYRPIWHEEKCIQCFFCWIYCPDNSILTEDGKVIGIDLEHCKGCGICAQECPDKASAIDMKLEAECDLPPDDES
jgi:pyruvate ferredoxin oxidoreductase delta subunit